MKQKDFSLTTANQPFMVYFGDGTECKAYDVTYDPLTDRYKFWMIPSERIINYSSKARYEYESNEQGVIIRSYLGKWVIHRDMSSEFNSFWIFCNFEGMETKATEFVKELADKITRLQDECELLKKTIASLKSDARTEVDQRDEKEQKEFDRLKKMKEIFAGSTVVQGPGGDVFNG